MVGIFSNLQNPSGILNYVSQNYQEVSNKFMNTIVGIFEVASSVDIVSTRLYILDSNLGLSVIS